MASAEYNDDDYRRLEELGGSDYEMKDGQPNIKGWDVYDVQRRRVGVVDELLFNPASRKVRYLIVDLKRNDFNLVSRKIAIPVGLAELHEHDDEVLLADVNAIHLTSLPAYEKGHPLTADRELAIRNAFVVDRPEVVPGADFYEHEHFNQNKFYGRRYQAPTTTTDNEHLLPEGDRRHFRDDTTGKTYTQDTDLP